jgi:hypothetical protein
MGDGTGLGGEGICEDRLLCKLKQEVKRKASKNQNYFPQGHRMMKKYKNNIPNFILHLEIISSQFLTTEISKQELNDIYLFLQNKILETNNETQQLIYVSWTKPIFEETSGLFFYGETICQINVDTIKRSMNTLITSWFNLLKNKFPFIDLNCQIQFSVKQIDLMFSDLVRGQVGELNETCEFKEEDEEEEQDDEQSY